MIMALSKLFRYATHTDGVLVTIREELENLSSYMTIVNARFGGRIEFAARVPEELLTESIVRSAYSLWWKMPSPWTWQEAAPEEELQ